MKSVFRKLRERTWEFADNHLLRSRSFRRITLRKLFAEHLSKGALGFVDYGDHGFFVDPRDQMIGFSLLSGEGWQRQTFDNAIEIAHMAGAFEPGGWFIDVGANIGTQTVYAMRSGMFCGCIAIEPEPNNFALLQRNIDYNGLKQLVRPVQLAASSQLGVAMLHCNSLNHGANRLEGSAGVHTGRIERVQTNTIDCILQQHGISSNDVGFVWIDVEEHEVEALRGMGHLRSLGVPIVAEVGGTTAAKCDTLKSLLDPHYEHATALDRISQPEPHQVEVQDLKLGSNRRDVLFYNRNESKSAQHKKSSAL